MLGLALLAASSALLVAGAELFAEHAAGAARRLGVSTLAVGLLLAGAEPEELVTALFAAVRGRPGIAAGDAVGANVTMLTLVVGLAALARPVPVSGEVRVYGAGAALAGALAALALRDGAVTRAEGAALAAVYVALVAAVWWRERRPPEIGEAAEAIEADGTRDEPAARALVLVAVGIGLMTVGGRLAVAGAERIVDAFGVADSAVGLTFVALATTAELLALVWSAARRELSELAVAGILGSAAYNATVTLGAAALVRPLATGGTGGAALAAAVLPVGVGLLGGRRGRVGRLGGVVLLAGYAAYLSVTL